MVDLTMNMTFKASDKDCDFDYPCDRTGQVFKSNVKCVTVLELLKY